MTTPRHGHGTFTPESRSTRTPDERASGSVAIVLTWCQLLEATCPQLPGAGAEPTCSVDISVPHNTGDKAHGSPKVILSGAISLKGNPENI